MSPWTRYTVSVLLTSTAGYVDAVGWLTYKHIYTANMSGNSVAVGIQLASIHWVEAAFRFWPVLMYVAGLLACRILLETAGRRRVARIAWLAFLIEIALLAAAVVQGAPVLTGIALLAVAMGIQNATLSRFGGITLHTGFVTGTLVKFSEEFSKYLFWVHDHRGGFTAAVRASRTQRSFQYSVWMAAVWISYVAGAILGALGDYRWALPALCAPIGVLTVLMAWDLRQPLAAADELDQLRADQ